MITFYDRLAAYYPCDTTHGRSLGEDVKGTNNATAGVASSATGKVREGMFLLASGSQFRSVPNDAAIQQIKGVCLWVRFSTIAADQVLLSKGSDATDANTSIKLWYDQSEDGFAYTVGDGASATTVTTSAVGTLVDTWYHVRVWNDGSRIGIAVDGTLLGSGTARTPLVETGLLYLGSAFGGGTYLDGILDEVALFSTAPTGADGELHRNGGDGASVPLLDTLPGPGGRAGHVTPWLAPSFAESDDRILYVAQGRMPVQRFDGSLAQTGVEAPDQKVTIKSSGSGSLTGKRFAYLRNLDANGRVSSVSPLSDVHDTFGALSGSVQAATNAAPIVITSTAHGLATGDSVSVTGQLGNTATNGRWTITKISANAFQLDGSVGNGDWSSALGPNMRVTTLQNGTGGANAVQSLEFSNTATGGTFVLYFEGEPTTAIAYNATAATIQAALRLLSTVGLEGVTCTGGPIDTTAVTITFSNELASQAVSLITVDYTGAASTIAATVTQTGSTGQNEIQTLDLLNTPTGGTFTVTFDGQTTGAIAYNANAATVEAALESLSNITVADLTTTGGVLPGTAITVEFGGTLAEANVAQMTINPSNLTGGPSIAISTPTPGAAGTDEWHYIDPSGNSGVIRKEAHTLAGNASVSAGTFTLTGEFGTTTALAYNATNLTVLEAIWVASGSKDYYTSGSGIDLSAGDSFVLTKGGSNGQQNYTDITVDSSGLTGGTYSMSAPADGTGGGFTIEGTYKLLFDGQRTSLLSFLDSLATVQSALESLSNIGAGNIEVYGGPLQENVMLFKFVGAMAGTNVTGSITVTESNVTTPAVSGTTDGVLITGGIGGTNETQRITTTGTTTEGTFKLTYSGQETADIAHGASAATVDAALEALSNVATGDVTCTGGPLPGSVIDVEFTGNLAGEDVTEMTVDDDGLYRITATTQLGSGPLNETVDLGADVTPQKGTFTLTFGGETTPNLPYTAAASEVQSKLEALTTVGTGNVICTGGPINSIDVTVEFQGALSSTDVGAITAASDMNQTVPSLLVTGSIAGASLLNEVQQIAVDGVTSGDYTLTYSAQTTAAIQFDATASEVQDSIEALSTVGNGNVEVTGGPLTAAPLRVEFVGALGIQDLAALTFSTVALYNGGWTTGANKLTYTDVATPVSTRVTRRQILRTKPGVAAVFWVDVDEEDVTSNTFSSIKTDDELLETVVLRDANGKDINLNRHGEPPEWKRSVASYQNHLFFAVDDVDRFVGSIASDVLTGVGTDWASVYDDRTLYADGSNGIADVTPGTQTAALTDTDVANADPTGLTLRVAHPDGQRVYASYVTASETLPESVDRTAPFTVARNERDGEMSGQFEFDGRFYQAFEHALYLYAFSTDPAQFPDGDGRMQVAAPRGLINPQCVAFSDNSAYLLDREGAYSFDGNQVIPESEVVKDFFSGRGGTKINWRYQHNFHSEYFPQQRTVKHFVVLDGGPYPRHAICQNVDQLYWWVEEYPWPITSSCQGSIDGQTYTFLGSTARRIFVQGGQLEGLRETSSTLQGTVASAAAESLTCTGASFDAGMVGLSLSIVEGTGFGQRRDITAVSGTTLSVKTPWATKPSTDSVFQVAGVSWSCKTGMLRYVNTNQREVRGVEILWEPTVNSQLLSYEVYEDWSATPLNADASFKENRTDGVRVSKGSPRFEVPLTGPGHAQTSIGGMRQTGATGIKYVSVKMQGTTNQEAHKVHGIAVDGAT